MYYLPFSAHLAVEEHKQPPTSLVHVCRFGMDVHDVIIRQAQLPFLVEAVAIMNYIGYTVPPNARAKEPQASRDRPGAWLTSGLDDEPQSGVSRGGGSGGTYMRHITEEEGEEEEGRKGKLQT